jgi:hypothetical protein
MKRLPVIVAALAFSAAAAAQAYKWVDADGKVRYGDTPPPGVKATPLRPPPGPISSPAPASPDAKKDKPLSPEAAFRKRQMERDEAEQKAAKERDDAERKRSNCESAQSRLRLLQSGARVATVDAQGERVFISDEERARDLERTQKAVTEACGG